MQRGHGGATAKLGKPSRVRPAEPSYRSKLKWAKHHLDDLSAAFLADHNAGRFGPDVKPDPNAASQSIQATFRVPDDLLVKYSLMAGDCIQNLRAALDHLAHALSGEQRQSQFPIYATVTDYAEKGLPRIEGMSATAQAAIERLQPYHAGQNVEGDPLRKLNRLSNIDKHRLLQVVGLQLTGERVREVERRQPIDPTIHVGYSSTGALVDGAVHRSIPAPKEGMHMQFDFAMGLTFQDVKPATGCSSRRCPRPARARAYAGSVVELLARQQPTLDEASETRTVKLARRPFLVALDSTHHGGCRTRRSSARAHGATSKTGGRRNRRSYGQTS